MPGKVAKIGTFSDWVGLFNDWRKDIGVNTDDIDAFHFDTLYGAIDTEEIEFGSYKGRRKWENLRQIPTQQMRDALMNMIVYQGDTEFASVEQQRNLLANAPDRVGSPRHYSCDDRRNAAWLADVCSAGRSLWLFGQS